MSAANGRKLLDTGEAADFLGISAGTLAQWRSSGRVKIPYSRIGKCVRYRPEDLEHFASSQIARGDDASDQ